MSEPRIAMAIAMERGEMGRRLSIVAAACADASGRYPSFGELPDRDAENLA